MSSNLKISWTFSLVLPACMSAWTRKYLHCITIPTIKNAYYLVMSLCFMCYYSFAYCALHIINHTEPYSSSQCLPHSSGVGFKYTLHYQGSLYYIQLNLNHNLRWWPHLGCTPIHNYQHFVFPALP
jgi:hypothetical protein